MKTQKTERVRVGLENGFWAFWADQLDLRGIRKMDGTELNNLALVLRGKLKKIDRELSARNYGLGISR